MHSGVPTILLFKNEYWEIHEIFSPLVSLLKERNIIFDDPLEAAHHVNQIADDPDKWWDSPPVQDARKQFNDYCGCSDDNWLEKWSRFFEQELDGVEG